MPLPVYLPVLSSFPQQAFVIENEEIDGAPTLIGSIEQRTLLSFGDTAFATGIPGDKGPLWQLYRPGKALVDPDTDETLGYEAIYLGDASVQKYDAVSTLKITKSVLDIQKAITSYSLRRDQPVIIFPALRAARSEQRLFPSMAVVDQGGQNSVITLNKGKRDGLENGHVLALYRKVNLPNTRENLICCPQCVMDWFLFFRTSTKFLTHW